MRCGIEVPKALKVAYHEGFQSFTTSSASQRQMGSSQPVCTAVEPASMPRFEDIIIDHWNICKTPAREHVRMAIGRTLRKSLDAS